VWGATAWAAWPNDERNFLVLGPVSGGDSAGQALILFVRLYGQLTAGVYFSRYNTAQTKRSLAACLRRLTKDRRHRASSPLLFSAV
jgi:hypothetical protein